MRWADRLARLSTPYVERVDSADSPLGSPPRDAFLENTPLSKAPIVSLGKANDAKDPFDIGVEKKKQPLPPVTPAETDADIETLALALMAEAERNPAVTITSPEKARLYYRGEAMRRLDLIRQRAIDATTGPDIERAAIMGEEIAPMLPAGAHAEPVAALLLAASPLHGVPGARPCRLCGRGIWTSPAWQGTHPPDLCAECSRGTGP